MKICSVFSGGEYAPGLRPLPADFTIAADSGYLHTQRLGIIPDVVVGDFDSLGYVPDAGEIIRRPVMKDDTDTMLAVRTGLARGCDFFYLYGCLGGRLDHTVANLQTLHFLCEQGARGVIADVGECVTVIKNGALHFAPEASGTVSVFALGGPAHGVTLTGLLYPLQDALLTSHFPLGVSNEFTGISAGISVKNGLLTVIWSGNADWLIAEEGESVCP